MAYQPLNNQQPYQPYQPVAQPYQYQQYPEQNQASAYVPPGSSASSYIPPSQSPYAPPPVNPAVPNVPAGYVAVAVDSRYIQFNQPEAEGNNQNPPGIAPNEWSDGICDCCDDAGICLLSFCCSCIRAALTVDRAKLLQFWKAFLFFMIFVVGLYFVQVYNGIHKDDKLTWPFPVAAAITLVYAFIRTYYRTKIREKYSIRGGAAEDCLLQCCCGPCAIAQEARHVDRCVGQLPINERGQQR